MSYRILVVSIVVVVSSDIFFKLRIFILYTVYSMCFNCILVELSTDYFFTSFNYTIILTKR